MDIRKVKKLIELMEESDLAEIEVKEGEDSVRISRGKRISNTLAEADDIRRKDQNSIETPSVGGNTVNAPMVGSFYRAASPSSPAFVEVGDRIKVGDILCIIESMKMMNQIRSEVSGTIEAILIENGQSVQFDQPLFTVV
ncbi:MAG: acetyl-CoA carboxylase biotin carboxyl carrier protein subunit [Gammaproteobacteria bacterium TMED1]|nr:MAG: acetyl-CoA carboxylase biotin carboxyl carrier protein subunit [Gammaproteobacteria bacterium TMED1]|tara:strand:- start:868 stop:1287 length:420 start_codon:yes stop_codon:yes gene_type:complete